MAALHVIGILHRMTTVSEQKKDLFCSRQNICFADMADINAHAQCRCQLSYFR